MLGICRLDMASTIKGNRNKKLAQTKKNSQSQLLFMRRA